MQIITWTGQRVEKPEWMQHNPVLSHTIRPKEVFTQAEIFEHIVRRGNEECETLTIHYLLPKNVPTK